MAKNTDIYNDQYLTEDEDDSDNEKVDNFYKFISTQAQHNDALNDYLDEIGVDAKSDMSDLSENNMQQIYNRLNEKDKNTMNTQFMKNIRKIVNRPNFTLAGGARKSKRKLRKTRKTRKNKTRILRKK
jgi:hypothetical protein